MGRFTNGDLLNARILTLTKGHLRVIFEGGHKIEPANFSLSEALDRSAGRSNEANSIAFGAPIAPCSAPKPTRPWQPMHVPSLSFKADLPLAARWLQTYRRWRAGGGDPGKGAAGPNHGRSPISR